MPNAHSSGGYVFIKKSDGDGGAYYDIIHPSGRHWDYEHWFSSIEEMDEYARNN